MSAGSESPANILSESGNRHCEVETTDLTFKKIARDSLKVYF